MSKNKKGEIKEEVPIDHQVESKNLQYTLTLKNQEIEMLKEENSKRKNHIISLQTESSNLKDLLSNKHILEKKLEKSLIKNGNQEKEIKKLNNDISNIQNQFQEEKKELEKFYLAQINQLKQVIANYAQKIEYANQMIKDNKDLKAKINDLKIEKDNILNNNIKELKKKDIQNDLKFSKLKKKILENIDKSQSQVFDLNKQYVDVKTQMTLYENKKLLYQMTLLNEELENLKNINEKNEKIIKELNNEIEIHKEVELSLSEKNKKLKKQLEEKGINVQITDEIGNDSFDSDFRNIKIFQRGLFKNSYDNKVIIEEKYAKIINLEKQVIELERKLYQKNDEYSTIKDKYNQIKTLMMNYEQKYSNFYNYLNDCLDNFFLTQEKKKENNYNIGNNIDSLKKYDFSNLSKEEKYSSIIILMDNLLPLIHECKIINETSNYNNRIYSYSPKYKFSGEKRKKQNNNILKISLNYKDNNISNNNKLLRSESKKNKVDTLPSIIPYKNIKIPKMPSAYSLIHHTES